MPQTSRAGANRVLLINNGTASGNFCEVSGGNYQLHAEGTWGGTTLSLQCKLPNDTPFAVPGVSLTANGVVAVEITAGEEIKAVLTGGSPTGMYVTLQRVGG